MPSIPIVSGSGARVPTQFLDRNGTFGGRIENGQTSRPSPVAIDLTEDDGEDFTMIEAKGPGVQHDMDAPVCIGLINAVVLTMFGLPESFINPTPNIRLEELNSHPRWNKSDWPPGADFFLQPGYRPVELIAIERPRAQIGAYEVVAPFDVRLQAQNAGSSVQVRPQLKSSPFGSLAEKYQRVLFPLMSRKMMSFSARCRIVSPNSGQSYLHAIELLCFAARRHVSSVSDFLFRENVNLEFPPSYEPSQFPGMPPLEVPSHNVPTHGRGSQFAMPSRGTLVPTKESTESEKRKQVDSVYASLPDGENLQHSEPGPCIGTPLLPHQKQALTFLFDREKERSFEEDGKNDGIVSLWKTVWRRGKIASYENVVTQGQQMRAPSICRGAIIADDMGLGKTLVAIALIASTRQEAVQFEKGTDSATPKSQSKSVTGTAIQTEQEDSDDEVTIEDFTINVYGAPMPSKKQRLAKGSKKKGKKELKKDEALQARLEQIVTRSRATLVVLPLTLVSAWESQIQEHWAADLYPSVYIYHGAGRLSDAKQIADHDIVMTTYSTLAGEYSLLTAEDEESDEEEDHEGDIYEVDDLGNDIQVLTAAEKAVQLKKEEKGRKKRDRLAKRKRKGENRVAPLQQIEWFRILLDEAHTIKEARTLQARAVCHLVGARRLCLTGTPVQNRIDDLFSLIRFLGLDPFDDRGVWNQFCGAREKFASLRMARRESMDTKNSEPIDSMALARVQTIMKFVTLRRTKDTPAPNGQGKLLDLPAKFTRVLKLEFDRREMATYNAMRQRYKDDFEQMKASDTLKYNYATILHEISNLRMTCDHMELVDASVDAKRRKDYATQGAEDDPWAAIQRDGLSRERAVRFFELLCSSDEARCRVCDHDLADFVDSVPSSPITTSVDEGARRWPVLTRCAHLFCSVCLRKAFGTMAFDDPTDDTRAACPECGVSVSPLTDLLQLQPSDVEHASGEILSADKFASESSRPIDQRSGYSSKVKALVEELEYFSKSNPASYIYDPLAPSLEQVAQKVEDGDAVVVKFAPKDHSEIVPIKSVVFSQWTKMLDRVATAIHRAGIKATKLDGRMRRQDRSDSLEHFRNDPSVEVLLISLKAGGIGLNLVSACRAYLLEPYWNPATENQGLDRIHRMGQTRPVVMTKYIMANSIEENMLELQKRKLQLAESVGGKRRSAMERDEELGILFGS